VLGRPVGQLPAADRPLDVSQVGGHVVAVVPELDPLGVVDAGGQPPLGPVVLHQHRGAGPEHPVAAGRLRLQAPLGGLADRRLQHRPALVHPAGEDQHRAEGGRGVQRGGVVAGDGQAPLAVTDGLLQTAVEHVGGGQGAEQGRPHRSGGRVLTDRGQGPLQAAGPGGQVLAEQVGEGDQPGHHRGRPQPVPGPGQQPVGLLVGLEGGGVVVDGRGLVADGGQQGRPLGRGLAGGQVALGPPVQGQRLPVGRPGGRLPAAVSAWR
jgi:hypothetical protein